MVKFIACFQPQNRNSRVRSFGYRKLPEHSLNLSILKLDGSSFVINVTRNARVAELKQAVEEAFNFSREDEGKILWSLVWSHFCLCYGSQKLVNDKASINCFGIKDGDQTNKLFLQFELTDMTKRVMLCDELCRWIAMWVYSAVRLKNHMHLLAQASHIT